MPSPILRALAITAALVLTACQTGGGRPSVAYQPAATTMLPMTPATWAQASRLLDRFEADRQRGGMVAVSANIEECYRAASRPVVQRLPLRECMVLDNFASRLNEQVERQLGGGGLLPYFSNQAQGGRLSRYGPMAGFADPVVLGGYLAQGSNSMFTVLAARQRR